MTLLRPADPGELREMLAACAAAGEAVEVTGAGTKRAIGRPLQTPHTLDCSRLAGIRDHDPAELVLTAGAATPLAEIEAALSAAGQMLAFEPPDWSALLGEAPGRQTLGGVLAANLAGPRRFKAGAARDHLLGIAAVSGRGEAFKAGGRVVKNVTGYDLCKLLAGSWGTLAVMSEVTVKVLPRPETERTVVVEGLTGDAAVRAMGEAIASPHEVSGAAHLPAPAVTAAGLPAGRAAVLLRVEGPAPSVDARAEALRTVFDRRGAVSFLDGDASASAWAAVRDVRPFAGGEHGTLWRLSVPPACGAAVAAAVAARLDARHFLDWGGGLVWLAVDDAKEGGGDGGAGVIRNAVAAAGGGHATLIRGAAALRAAVDVFEPQPGPLAALAERVREGFDPRRILNPGRLSRGPEPAGA